MYLFKPETKAFFNDSTSDNIELTDIFSIFKIYSEDCQIDLFTNKPIPPFLIKKEFRKYDECPDCYGTGLITLDDTVGKHNYTVECDCAECESTGKIYFEEPREFEILQKINCKYNSIEFLLEFHLAKTLFNLHGERCKYLNDGILFRSIHNR